MLALGVMHRAWVVVSRCGSGQRFKNHRVTDGRYSVGRLAGPQTASEIYDEALKRYRRSGFATKMR